MFTEAAGTTTSHCRSNEIAPLRPLIAVSATKQVHFGVQLPGSLSVLNHPSSPGLLLRLSPHSGMCDDRGFWVGVHHPHLVSRMLLSLQRVAGTPTLRSQALLCNRHHSTDSFSGGGVSREPGQHPRRLIPAEPSFPANSADGANGSKRRHLETSGLGCLCAQQGWPYTHTQAYQGDRTAGRSPI
ncbi:unnamed protein product [Tetraodon nigroviridis]|uniref:(spotted green pufferfish) hypothetical protein n=1 Tax=Tetraodon nigroviridis TaxID=99883 RepID=Q4RZM3_TETNG|nr:unnamed protein product [Tetraodon nigroviridis]